MGSSNSPFYPLLFLVVLVTFSSTGQESSIIAPGATLELVASDYEFTEGPAVDHEGNVFFTDQPNDRILKWSAGFYASFWTFKWALF